MVLGFLCLMLFVSVAVVMFSAAFMVLDATTNPLCNPSAAAGPTPTPPAKHTLDPKSSLVPPRSVVAAHDSSFITAA